ncbi:MAG: hypothetical protein ABWY12_03275 [Burkholderiales bacterium]
MGVLNSGIVVTGSSSSDSSASVQRYGLTGRRASEKLPNNALRRSFSSALSSLFAKKYARASRDAAQRGAVPLERRILPRR